MTKEYKYRPSLKYLLIGLGGLLMSFISAIVIGRDDLWFSIIMIAFCFMTLIMVIAFLTLFFRKFNIEHLKLGPDFIEIPGRWKDQVRLDC